MNDPLVAMAVALQATPGAYALLLGSGLSRSAQVPTGWEDVLDLARRLADEDGEAAAKTLPAGSNQGWEAAELFRACWRVCQRADRAAGVSKCCWLRARR